MRLNPFKKQSSSQAGLPLGTGRRRPDTPLATTGGQPVRTYSSLGVQRPREPARRMNPESQNRAFSYFASRSQSELNVGREAVANTPVKRRASSKLRRMRSHAGWLAGGVLVFGVVVYQMQLSSTAKVVSLVPAADAPFLRETRVYAEAAAKLIDSSAANRNKMTINTSAITSGLQSQFPELQSVTVAIPLLGDTPTVYIRPADPALVLVTAGGTFVVDRQGRALGEPTGSDSFSQLGLPTVTDQSSLTFRLGDQALPRATAQFIETIDTQYDAQRTEIKAMTLPAASSELDVYPAGKPYFVKYNIQDPTEQAAKLQSGAYFAAFRHLASKRITPSQYVDVRLQGRVYYK